MVFLSQLIFLIIILAATFILIKKIRRIRKNILMGREIDRYDRPGDRMKKMLLVAFGQKKMFKRPIPAILHLFLYVGFFVINLEILEFTIDGLAGTHRIFAPFLGNFYTFIINIFEFLALAVLISCAIFLIRRNLIRLKRFHAQEMTQWPKLDANLILIIEIGLMLAIFTMNATDQVLQTREAGYTSTSGTFYISSLLIPLCEGPGTTTLVALERITWWFHILGVLGFGIYVMYSKHLHIFMAFPNTYFSKLEPAAEFGNMPEVTKEVNLMLGLPQPEEINHPDASSEAGRFGAKDVNDLHWKNLMDAYTCTECGRCTSECPANQTGKKLSPRKIMMDTRDRMEEIAASEEKGGPGINDGKFLLDNYITREELNACTSCMACVEACPVNIDPLSIILQMRRYIAMEESGAPPSWQLMFSNIETNFAPWKFSPSERFNWADDFRKEP